MKIKTAITPVKLTNSCYKPLKGVLFVEPALMLNQTLSFSDLHYYIFFPQLIIL